MLCSVRIALRFMLNSSSQAVYLVDCDTDPVRIKISGKANFQNSACLKDFFQHMLGLGKYRFVLDFETCATMDSTFLGVLAGAALEIKRKSAEGKLILFRLGDRNLELVRSLGLHRLMLVESGDLPLGLTDTSRPLECEDKSDLDRAELALEAHQNLIKADEANLDKFQDVLVFLKNKIDKKC
jgi:anti-sigma B factor antagonist